MARSRQTLQKKQLDSTLKSMNGFFTAEEFHKRVIKNAPHIGIATVYRFLSEKTSLHLLHSYVCEKKTIYSSSSNSHCHYTCHVCGKKSHVLINDIRTIRKNIKGSICHFQIDVTGVCENCMKK